MILRVPLQYRSVGCPVLHIFYTLYTIIIIMYNVNYIEHWTPYRSYTHQVYDQCARNYFTGCSVKTQDDDAQLKRLLVVVNYCCYYFAFLPGLLLLAPARGGVTGRPLFSPPYWYFAFLSAGFKIWKLHINVSSTLIIPPALSNSPQ